MDLPKRATIKSRRITIYAGETQHVLPSEVKMSHFFQFKFSYKPTQELSAKSLRVRLENFHMRSGHSYKRIIIVVILKILLMKAENANQLRYIWIFRDHLLTETPDEVIVLLRNIYKGTLLIILQ